MATRETGHVHDFRIDSTERLAALRREMEKDDLDAFLVPSGDSHQSEKVGPVDARRQWLSGFTGSAGFAVVTKEKAALWTDGRYKSCRTHIYFL